MRTAPKLAVYGLAVAAMFGVGAAAGAVAGPLDVGGEGHVVDPGDDEVSVAGAAGLSIAAGGFRLAIDSDELPAGRESDLGFRVLDEDGVAVTDFDILHDRRLHLIVVSRNLIDYAHIHPEMSDDGHWTVAVPALGAGSYRVFADFQAADSPQITLGADVSVQGEPAISDLPSPSSVSQVDDYRISVDGISVPGESTLTFTVRRGAEVVTTDPYLGAAGHLVAIRQGDLAYLHVHPVDGEAPSIRFAAEYPSAGTYRLFLDFSHDGVVRTASFTVVVPDGGDTPSDAPMPDDTTHEGH